MMVILHLYLLVVILALLGFSYILWVMASKESGWIRMGGQILAALLKLAILGLVIALLVVGHRNGGLLKRCCPMMGGQMMGKGGMMMDKGDMKMMMMKKMKGDKGKMMKEMRK